MSSSKHRVVITGTGLVTPTGNTTNETWDSLIAGRSGIIEMEDPILEGFPSKVAGLVKNEQEMLNEVFSLAKQRKADRFIRLAVLAAYEAMHSAGLDKTIPSNRERFGAYIGVGVGGLTTFAEAARLFDKSGRRAVSPFLLPRTISSEAPGWISMEFDLQGPMLSVANACASGANAIGLAYQAICNGEADYMVAGGTESCINELSMAGFGNMRALSTWQGDPKQACRPFSNDRCGFVIAEGAGVVVLERKDLAEKRGAPIIAEVVGYGCSSDAYHLTAIHPEGRGGIQSIKNALSQAKINPESIGYINAHGTATKMNDFSETKIIKKVFGDHVEPSNPNHAVISSTKSMTGHMLGGTGSAEIAFCALALKNKIVPPTINLDEPDPECDLDYVPHSARSLDLEYALSSSFGFGGGNAVVVLKKV
jgi:3-oxoacyl-[acyl-carrier-protein] synthase II